MNFGVAWLAAVFLLIGVGRASASLPVSMPAVTPSTNAEQPPSSVANHGGTKVASYVGNAVCKACHLEQTREFTETVMGNLFMLHPRDEQERLGCEGCHGPGSLHVGSGGKSPGAMLTFRLDSPEAIRLANEACLRCHERGEQGLWRAGVHAERGVACGDCHKVMRRLGFEHQLAAAREVSPFVVRRAETEVCLRCHLDKRAQINLPSHMPVREGAMSCADCHNPHGGPFPHMLQEASVAESCYRCHAEKRGPFLWTHPPVTEDCSNCHEPHGTVNDRLLKVREPRLCQQCHVGTFHPATPQNPDSVFVFNRSCTNCHSQIHGSNSPGGRVFTR